VGLLGGDYIDLRPSLLVQEGDRVRLGQALITDKQLAGVQLTSPAAGFVKAIHRGDKRAFQSIEIAIDGDDEIAFDRFLPEALVDLGRPKVQAQLLNSGLWAALRSRPYGKTADPAQQPHSLFITAIDTLPLAADPSILIRTRLAEFVAGCQVLQNLTEGTTYICVGAKEKACLPKNELQNARIVQFDGPHPAGLPGTHIHFLDPVGERKTVWQIGYQDVIAVGHFFLTGRILTERLVSLAGPQVREPKLIRSRVGADLQELTAGALKEGENRVVSGSALCGHWAQAPVHFLGRYHNQVTVLSEGRERVFLGWLRLGFDKFSLKRVFASRAIFRKTFPFTTSLEGSERFMTPIGMYEKVMPLDILPTQLLRSLCMREAEMSADLGALELIEEDIALCTFVCPGKINYETHLRDTLRMIERGD
jgi:Na+-transporting NADH:ubiquinone oxidoreductase subunit A